MTLDALSPRNAVWSAILKEAEKIASADAIFGQSLSATIFDHGDLGSALAYQIGRKLGSRGDREIYSLTARQAFHALPEIVDAARADLHFQDASSHALQISIHPSAAVGRSVFLDHGTGIVVGAFVTIGDEVTIMQNVTLGRGGKADGGAPTIGRGVLLSAGATVLGEVVVGDFAKIGAGSIVTTDVPAGCTAVGVPARLVNCPALAS
jgi:serine O-acetyltransferase